MLWSRLAPGVWPDSALVTGTGELSIGGVGVTTLAADFGTPLDVVDLAALRARWRAYREALPGAEICCPGTLTRVAPVLDLLCREQLSLSVTTCEDLRRACRAGFPRSSIVGHGFGVLGAALDHGVDRIVLPRCGDRVPRRIGVLPRADIDGNGVQVGPIPRTGCRVAGLYCQLADAVADVPGFERAVRWAVDFLAGHGMAVPQLVLGSVRTASHVADEPDFDLPGFSYRVRVALGYECQRRGLPVPRLVVEPGRGLTARTGLSLRRVTAVRRGSVVELDGGTAPCRRVDGDRHSLRIAGRESAAPPQPVTVVSGRQTGTTAVLPADVHPGDLIALPCTELDHPQPYGTGCTPTVTVGGGAATAPVTGGVPRQFRSRR